MLGHRLAIVGKQVLIVGAGVVGLSSALHAARRGHRVTVVDRRAPDGGGCSFGNAGMVVPSHFVPLAAPGMVALGLRRMWNPESPFYIKPRLSADLLRWGFRFWQAATEARVARAAPLLRDLHLAGRAGFEEWTAAFGDDFGLTKNGILMLCRTAHGLEEEVRNAQRAERIGIPVERLTVEEAARVEPGIRMEVAGAIYYPLDCHLDPGRLMAALQREVEKAGVVVTWETEVLGWRAKGQRLEAVRTSRGDISAEDYVLCGGAWSSAMARDLDLSLPMEAGKGYNMTLRSPPRLPRVALILSEGFVAITPMGNALRFAGTMELAGLDETVNPARLRGIMKSVAQSLPEFGADVFRDAPVWCGLRPCSPDGLPYVGRFARYANLVTATGHGMMGVSLAPITGRLVAEILEDEAPSLDIGLLSPDRFARG